MPPKTRQNEGELLPGGSFTIRRKRRDGGSSIISARDYTDSSSRGSPGDAGHPHNLPPALQAGVAGQQSSIGRNVPQQLQAELQKSHSASGKEEMSGNDTQLGPIQRMEEHYATEKSELEILTIKLSKLQIPFEVEGRKISEKTTSFHASTSAKHQQKKANITFPISSAHSHTRRTPLSA